MLLAYSPKDPIIELFSTSFHSKQESIQRESTFRVFFKSTSLFYLTNWCLLKTYYTNTESDKKNKQAGVLINFHPQIQLCCLLCWLSHNINERFLHLYTSWYWKIFKRCIGFSFSMYKSVSLFIQNIPFYVIRQLGT